tara:strand:- start:240 stop:362 length:123 start_codon:yes stop_codon:yes gene_type:complete
MVDQEVKLVTPLEEVVEQELLVVQVVQDPLQSVEQEFQLQ